MAFRSNLMCVCFAIIFCVLHSIQSTRATVQQPNKTCETLYLLSIVPYPDNRSFAGWDKGFELIPAGRLATKHINANRDILQGYELELINIRSEACGINTITEGLAEYHRELYYNHSTCVIGIIGLFCSTMTDTIAPIANHPVTGYAQLAASTSPLHRNTALLPHTFYVISSSRVFNQAMIALMKEFNWRKINIIHGSLGVYFTTTVSDFVELVESELGVRNISAIEIIPSNPISDVLEMIKDEERRIGYFTITNRETARLMCEVYKTNFSSRYTFIFDHRSLSEIYSTPVNCTENQIAQALEGVYIMQYRLVPPNTSAEETLVSGFTYEQYSEEYIDELRRFQQEKMDQILDENNLYANLLYDQVWAFAMAANRSLDRIGFLNNSITSNNVRDIAVIRDLLTKELKNIEFNGASGFIKFGEEQEVQTSVDIYQVRNGTLVLIGMYDGSLKFKKEFDNSSLLDDTFDTRYHLVSLWLGSLTILCDGLLILLTLFNTIAIVTLKNQAEIKSTGFNLSLVILFGCYLQLFSPIITTARVMFDSKLPTILCSLQFWLFINGTNVILVTLLLRLVRTFHIFRSFRSTGKFWSDRYLLLYVILLCSPMLALMVIQSAVDPFNLYVSRTFVSSTNPPHIQLHQFCTSSFINVWLSLSFGLIGMVMIFAIFFAIQTRHIKHKHFKDTKKVTIFIFSICITYAIFIPMWYVFLAVDINTLAYVCECIVNLEGAALCQIFLFLPKTLPALYKIT